jgi:CHAT domain-containing protein
MGEGKYSINIGGDVSGQVASGEHIIQVQTNVSDGAEEVEAPVRILFLAANPKDTDRLRLDEEVRTIDERLREADYRDRLVLVPHFAVRREDLQQALLRYQPHVVHFSGHGSTSGAIILEDSSGQSSEVSPEALGGLFGILEDNLVCVVLNACYSATQAEAVSAGVDCVIGTTRAITDSAAIRFAGGFYTGLGYGKSIATAFALGQNEIDLAALGEADTPRLVTREGVDASSIHLVGADGSGP